MSQGSEDIRNVALINDAQTLVEPTNPILVEISSLTVAPPGLAKKNPNMRELSFAVVCG